MTTPATTDQWGRHATPPKGSFLSVSTGGYNTCAVRTGGWLSSNDRERQSAPPSESRVVRQLISLRNRLTTISTLSMQASSASETESLLTSVLGHVSSLKKAPTGNSRLRHSPDSGNGVVSTGSPFCNS